MLNKFRKILVIGMMILIFMPILWECGDCQPADVSVSDEREQAEPVKIGFCCWGYDDRLGSSYERYFEYVEDAFNMEVILKGGGDNLQQQMKNVEELIEAGCLGIVGVRISGEMMDQCEAAGIYLAQFGSEPSDPELLAYLEESPYWVGYSIMDEYDCGKILMRSLYDAGARNIIMCAQASGGGAPNVRWTGFLDEAEKYPDLNIVEKLRISEGTRFGETLHNVLDIYPEIDGIVSAQGTVGAMEAIAQTIKETNNVGRIVVACADIEGDMEQYFDDGILTCVAGGSFPEAIFLTLCVLDKINGVSTVDGPVKLKSKMVYLYNEYSYHEYIQYIDSENTFPYTIEELKTVTATTNPEAAYEDMENLWSDYSLYDVKKRHNEQ